ACGRRRELEGMGRAQEQGVRSYLDHRRLVHCAVDALAADEEEQIRLEPGHLLEVGRDGVHAAIERVPVGEIHEHLPRREHRRVQQLREPDGLGLGAAAPDVVAEHQHGTPGGAEPTRDRVHRFPPRAAAGGSIRYPAPSPICASSPSRLSNDALIERYTGPVGGVVASRSARAVATGMAFGSATTVYAARASFVMPRIVSAWLSPGCGASPRKSWSSEAQSPAMTSSAEPACCALKSWPASCHEPPSPSGMPAPTLPLMR